MTDKFPGPIVTEDLQLVILPDSYAQYALGVLDYYKRNREGFREWEPARKDEFYTLEYHRSSLKLYRKRAREGSEYRFWIFMRKDKELKRIIGTLSFSSIIKGAFLSCYSGYSMDTSEQNCGYMSQALGAGIEMMFQTIGLHRIEANIMPRNTASLRIVEKLGFKNEGLSPAYLKINGKWEDHIHMVLRNGDLE